MKFRFLLSNGACEYFVGLIIIAKCNLWYAFFRKSGIAGAFVPNSVICSVEQFQNDLLVLSGNQAKRVLDFLWASEASALKKNHVFYVRIRGALVQFEIT